MTGGHRPIPAAGRELVLLLSAGRGPQECAWAVGRLLGRLEADARRRRITVRQVRVEPAEVPGTYRSVLLGLSGTGVTGFAADWSGTLCWQAPSPYRTGIGRKNWFVTAQIQDAHPEAVGFDPDDVEFAACRTGGAGGQHRDKASTAVRATHRPTATVVVVDTERRLSDNRRLALEMLRQRVEQANVETVRDAEAARWRTHDGLVRGAATRTERP